jgi:hypothetical protein
MEYANEEYDTVGIYLTSEGPQVIKSFRAHISSSDRGSIE